MLIPEFTSTQPVADMLLKIIQNLQTSETSGVYTEEDRSELLALLQRFERCEWHPVGFGYVLGASVVDGLYFDADGIFRRSGALGTIATHEVIARLLSDYLNEVGPCEEPATAAAL